MNRSHHFFVARPAGVPRVRGVNRLRAAGNQRRCGGIDQGEGGGGIAGREDGLRQAAVGARSPGGVNSARLRRQAPFRRDGVAVR
jgi:hypothetical protein